MNVLEPRLEQTALLLRLLPLYEHDPETSTGALVRRQSQPGVGPSHRVACPACGGERYVRRRGIAYGCIGCGGSGEAVSGTGLISGAELKRRLGRGWVDSDDYTGLKVASAETELESKLRWVRCDAGCERGLHRNGKNCRYCADSGRPGYVLAPAELVRFRAPGVAVEVELPRGEADPLVNALEQGFRGFGRARERRRLAGSFEELIEALRSLRDRLEPVHALVVATYVEAHREPGEMSEQLRLRLRLGLRLLEMRMPEPIRVPSGAKAIERRRLKELRERRARLAAEAA